MHTKIQPIDPENPNLTDLQEAADLLNAGELVAFPTETVYGLGANAFDATAVAKIFAAKERPSADPLIVHIYSLAQLDQITASVPPLAWELAHRFWPGPLTLILPRHPTNIPPSVSSGLDTVAVRMPNHKIPHALFKLGDLAVAAPSANLFTRPSPTTAQHVLDDLGGRLPLILDGGSATIGVESTVLDLTQEPPVILRPGGLPREALTAVLPHITYTPRYTNLVETKAASPSPGTHLKHYAPNVALRLYKGETATVLAQMKRDTAVLTASGQRVGLLIAAEDVAHFESTAVYIAQLGSLNDLSEMARTLFAHLRQLERADVDIVLTRLFSDEGLGLALRDRLIRATEGQIIPV